MTIQSILKAKLVRMRYVRMRDFVVSTVIKIQAFIKMKLQRKKYLKKLAILYFKSAIMIQKYLRGLKVAKKYTPERHEVRYKVMDLAMEELL